MTVLAVELYLGEQSEGSVSSLWKAIDALGIRSLGSAFEADYRPHVSLAVFAKTDTSVLCAALDLALVSCPGMSLPLTFLGFFLGPSSVAYLGVTPTQRLLETHRAVHDALLGVVEDSLSLYEPGVWVPHCTLAMSVDAPEKIFADVQAHLPVEARAAEAHIVEITSGRSIARLV